MQCPLCLPLLVAALSFASCATAPPAEYQPDFTSEASVLRPQATSPQKRRKKRVRLELFYQDNEFGEIELDPDGGATTDLRDAQRDRTGFRATFGSSAVRGYAQVYAENWDIDPLTAGFDFDIFGLGGGVIGAPTLYRFNDDMRLILPFRAGVNLAAGLNDASGVIDTDIYYYELEGEVGFGGDLYGAQPSVGVYVSSLDGTLLPDLGADSDISGTNTGVFFQLMYRRESFPVYGALRATGGDVEGATVSFGFAF